MEFQHVFPLFWKLTFILPIDRIASVEDVSCLTNMWEIQNVFKTTQKSHVDEVFEAILLRIEALKMRPKKIAVIENILGNDIGNIVDR